MENSIHTNNTNSRSHLLPKALLVDNETVIGEVMQTSYSRVVKTIKDFQQEIELVISSKKVSFMDAVLLYCEKTGMEVEVAGSLIKSSAKLKARIQMDAEELCYLPKSSKLPI